jgi:hypothetical protein
MASSSGEQEWPLWRATAPWRVPVQTIVAPRWRTKGLYGPMMATTPWRRALAAKKVAAKTMPKKRTRALPTPLQPPPLSEPDVIGIDDPGLPPPQLAICDIEDLNVIDDAARAASAAGTVIAAGATSSQARAASSAAGATSSQARAASSATSAAGVQLLPLVPPVVPRSRSHSEDGARSSQANATDDTCSASLAQLQTRYVEIFGRGDSYRRSEQQRRLSH